MPWSVGRRYQDWHHALSCCWNWLFGLRQLCGSARRRASDPRNRPRRSWGKRAIMACISEQTEFGSRAFATVPPDKPASIRPNRASRDTIVDCEYLACNPGAWRLLGHRQACETRPTLGLQQSSHRRHFHAKFLGLYGKLHIKPDIRSQGLARLYSSDGPFILEKWNMSDDLISVGARHTVALHDIDRSLIQLEYLLEGRSFFLNKNQCLSWTSTKNPPSGRYYRKVHGTLRRYHQEGLITH